MEEHDVIVIGAGHNGLTTAAYLVKAGLDVLVLERNSFIGGGAITREVTLPGFKHNLASIIHILCMGNPIIARDELGLFSEYGLKFNYPEIPFTTLFPDDSYIAFYVDIDKTCESIARLSPKDAEAYRRFYEWAKPLLELVIQGYSAPPPPIGSFLAQMDTFEEGRELIRSFMLSCRQILDDWFEDERLKAGLLRITGEPSVSPDEAGTGIYLFLMIPIFHSLPPALPVGGSGAPAEALARLIKANGGEVRTDCPVGKIRVANGSARSVVLESGEEIRAKRAIISNLNVKQIFPYMIEGYDLDPKLVDKVQKLKHSTYNCINTHYALNEPPNYKAGEEVNRTALVEVTMRAEDQLKVFDEYKYGVWATEAPLVVCPTLFDPSQAPEGKHTMYLLHFEPYELEDGGGKKWDEVKEQVADGLLETLRKHTTNMGAENVLARFIQSPLDLERMNPAWIHGDYYHIRHYLPQFFSYRPLPELGQYRTPVERFYLCGPSTHPGGTISYGGRAATMVIMEDLGIDFEKVIS